MSSVLEKVEATLSKAEKVKLEIVQKTARRDQLLERLESEYGLKSVKEAEAKVEKLDAELVSTEKEMEALRLELNEALSV